jgi:hypothetical protein
MIAKGIGIMRVNRYTAGIVRVIRRMTGINRYMAGIIQVIRHMAGIIRVNRYMAGIIQVIRHMAGIIRVNRYTAGIVRVTRHVIRYVIQWWMLWQMFDRVGRDSAGKPRKQVSGTVAGRLR